MDAAADCENYWNRSSSKGFSFDDDDDNTELDIIDSVVAGGTGVGEASKWGSLGILNDDVISESCFEASNALGPALNLSIKSILSDEALKLILEEQTLSDQILPKNLSPEEELKLLRKQIQTTLYSPSPEATAQKLLLGKQCSLEVFRSLHEKEQLLDAVLTNGGGDAVIGVLIFLRRTLKSSKFQGILQQRPKALQHYISYLTTQGQEESQISEACELLRMFGQHDEAVMLEFSTLHQRTNSNDDTKDLLVRQQKLRQLLERYHSGPAVVDVYQQIFQSEIKLIELIESEKKTLDNLVHADSTPIEVLYACCRKHTNWQEPDLQKSTSPFRLCIEQQISPAQFEWTALNERAAAQAYADLECVFERVPTWHPLKQKQFHISFSLEAAIKRLFELKAPASVLYIFVSKMTNANEKLLLAKKVKCAKAVIDALVSLKDAAQLTQLKDSLPARSEEQFYCERALKGLQTKRWSTDGIKIKL